MKTKACERIHFDPLELSYFVFLKNFYANLDTAHQIDEQYQYIVSWKTIKIRHALIILNDLENLTYVSGNIKKWNELAKALHVVVLPAICLGIFLLPSAT